MIEDLIDKTIDICHDFKEIIKYYFKEAKDKYNELSSVSKTCVFIIPSEIAKLLLKIFSDSWRIPSAILCFFNIILISYGMLDQKYDIKLFSKIKTFIKRCFVKKEETVKIDVLEKKKEVSGQTIENLTEGSIIRDYSVMPKVPTLNTEGSIIRSSKEIEEEKEGFVSLLAYVKMYQALEEKKHKRNNGELPIVEYRENRSGVNRI